MKITLLFLILSLVVLASGKTRWFQLSGYSFEKYLQEYNKHYASNDEYNFRKQIFEQRLIEINSHNQDSTKSWKKGVNHMSDWTTEEQRRLLGYRKMPRLQQSKTVPQKKTTDLPKSIDWRDKNIISAVKDQGQCGSCWTFGTAETVESYWAISTGQLTDLSEQQILDCTPNPDDCGGFGGCQGGTPEIAYAQIIRLGGLATEWTYPYASYYGTNQSCSFNNPSPAFAKLSGYEVLPSNDYNAVVQHLSSTGPLAINVDASVWFEYESGIFTSCNQTNVDIDHVVQLVGYGNGDKEDGQDYWIIRNSWSPAWGEDGYIRLPKEENPTCGTDYRPQDGTGCNGGPSQVSVCGACGILYDTSYPIISQSNKQ